MLQISGICHDRPVLWRFVKGFITDPMDKFVFTIVDHFMITWIRKGSGDRIRPKKQETIGNWNVSMIMLVSFPFRVIRHNFRRNQENLTALQIFIPIAYDFQAAWHSNLQVSFQSFLAILPPEKWQALLNNGLLWLQLKSQINKTCIFGCFKYRL